MKILRTQIQATPGGSDGCDEPGCFTDKITYAANADQLEVLSTKESPLTVFRLWYKSHTDVSKESSKTVHQMHWLTFHGGLDDTAKRSSLNYQLFCSCQFRLITGTVTKKLTIKVVHAGIRTLVAALTDTRQNAIAIHWMKEMSTKVSRARGWNVHLFK